MALPQESYSREVRSKINRSTKTPWQEYSGVAYSYSLAPATSSDALCELPFHDLHHKEFIRTTGVWVHPHSNFFVKFQGSLPGCYWKSRKKMISYRVVLTKIAHSKSTALSKNQKAKRKNRFSMLHLNMGSLPKNVSLLEDFLPQLMNPLESLPSLKRSFSKNIKNFLLSEQYLKKPVSWN